MAEQHGATTIKSWMEDLVSLARSGQDFSTGAGAEPGRKYAYLEFHPSEHEHSILLFIVDTEGEEPMVRAHRIDGDSASVREQVDALTHGART